MCYNTIMTRPQKNRIVSCPPGALVYKPTGIPTSELGQVVISLDEYEAINLLDYQGMDQESAAGEMGVSRPTVTRIYSSARKKIAQALAEGKAIHIEGGSISPNNTNCPRINGKGQCRGRKGRNWNCGRLNSDSDNNQQ